MAETGRSCHSFERQGQVPDEVVEAVLGLSWLFGRGHRRAHCLLGELAGPREIWGATEKQLRSWGATPRWVHAFLEARRQVPLEELRRSLRRSGLGVLPNGCPGFPGELLQLDVAPAGLFLSGSEESLAAALARPRITIVGSRRPDSYGLSCATAFASAFARAGVTVLSGMALGIDGRAHVAALDEGGPSVAVLGSGADTLYPKRHRQLYQRLVRSAGVLSELPPGARPAPWTFPWRNRLLAALGDAVLVIQAGEKSGALSTVEHAAALGRYVFVVPGRVRNSVHAGCNMLLHEGAWPAIDPDTLVEDFFSATRTARGERVSSGCRPKAQPAAVEGPLGPVERLVLFALQAGEGSVEALARATGCGVSEVAAACAVLEVKGRSTRAETGVYALIL